MFAHNVRGHTNHLTTDQQREVYVTLTGASRVRAHYCGSRGAYHLLLRGCKYQPVTIVITGNDPMYSVLSHSMYQSAAGQVKSKMKPQNILFTQKHEPS